MVGGENTNTGYKPDWRYDMTGGGVKIKSKAETQAEPETVAVSDGNDYVPDWPYDMTGGKTKSHKTEEADVPEATLPEAEKVAEVTEIQSSESDYVPDWPYDMTGGKIKSHKTESEAPEAETAAEVKEADAAEQEPDYVPDWPYDMTGGKSKTQKAEAVEAPVVSEETEPEAEVIEEPQEADVAESDKDYVPDWPYDMTGGKSKTQKAEVAEEPEAEITAEVQEENAADPDKDYIPDWPYDMTGGKSKSQKAEVTEEPEAEVTAEVQEEDAADPDKDYVPDWPYDMTGGKTKSHKTEGAAPDESREPETAPAKEDVVCKAKSHAEDEKKSKTEPYWPYDMSSGNKNNIATESVDDSWPYDMSGGYSKNKSSDEQNTDISTEEIISEDNIVGWVGLDDYLFTDSRQVLLSHSNISIDDELMIFNEDHHYIALNCVWALWFDVDKYFGVKTHEYDSVYVNFYTNWSPYDGLKAYVTLQGDNSEMYFDWELTEIEKKLLIEKLDSYTRSKTGMNLYDYYNKENSQT